MDRAKEGGADDSALPLCCLSQPFGPASFFRLSLTVPLPVVRWPIPPQSSMMVTSARFTGTMVPASSTARIWN